MDWLEELKNMSYPPGPPEDAIENGLGMTNDLAVEWHKTRPASWVENVRRGVLMNQWGTDDVRRSSDRRKAHSIKMKETWENNRELMTENARQNGRHGLSGKDIHNTLDIEYKGVVYYGYRELKEVTGVSKHLYNKYYLKGIDPEPRIGKDGPVKGTKYNVKN
jgi:hypothetical protein